MLSAPASVEDFYYSNEEGLFGGEGKDGRGSETSIQYSIEIDLEKVDRWGLTAMSCCRKMGERAGDEMGRIIENGIIEIKQIKEKV